jgi:hypothetical protein
MKYTVHATCKWQEGVFTDVDLTYEEAKEFEEEWMKDIPGDACNGVHTFEIVEQPEEQAHVTGE